MDPLTGLGAGAAVVQLADLGFRLTHELCTFVKQASRAENEMLRLQSALSDLVLILYQVKQFLNDFMREGIDNEGVQELLLPLRGCIAEVSWLQSKIPRQIYQPVKQLVGLQRKLKWAFASKDIRTSLSRLENQKTSLMAAMTVVSSRIGLKIAKEVQASSTMGTSTHDRLYAVESKVDALITETATARAAHGGLIFTSALPVVATDALVQANRDHIRSTLKEYSDNLTGRLPLSLQTSARLQVQETLPSTLNDICRSVRVLAELLPDDNITSRQENIEPSSHKVFNPMTSGLDSTIAISELSDESQGSRNEVVHYNAQRNSAFKKSTYTVQRRCWRKTFPIGEIHITTSRETLNDKSGVAIFICNVLFRPRSFLSKSGIRVVYKQRSDPRGSPSIGLTWNSHRVLEPSYPIFDYIWERNVAGVQRLLDDNQFSPYDRSRDLMSPFCMAVALNRVDICRSMVARVHNPKMLLRENGSLLDMIISCFAGSKATFQELSETIRFLQLYTDISEVHPHALCDELAYAGSVIPTKTGYLNPAVREVIPFLKQIGADLTQISHTTGRSLFEIMRHVMEMDNAVDKLPSDSLWIKFLFDIGVDTNVRRYGVTGLHLACILLTNVIRNEPYKATCRNWKNAGVENLRKPLSAFLLRLISLYLKHGADIYAVSDFGRTVSMEFITGNEVEFWEILLKRHGTSLEAVIQEEKRRGLRTPKRRLRQVKRQHPKWIWYFLIICLLYLPLKALFILVTLWIMHVHN